ncbi:hypothetical protein GT360_15055 [Vibrio astriarenae]|uniref:Porin n=1 Tax=Vibrio astriarenae TaxID=1481923 RepID=A0A7Z2T666_9VIBR|nr:porin family protein [Vibrio astriarenae]QIA64882.1 hypothetical protein GT360_15055 [Vibrio astriarenae]
MKKTLLALIIVSYPLYASENLERLSPSYAGGALQGNYYKSESDSEAGIKLQVGNGKIAGTLDYVNVEDEGEHYGATNLGFKFKTSGLFGGAEINLHSDEHFRHYGNIDPEYGFHFGYDFNPNLYVMWERDKADFDNQNNDYSTVSGDVKQDVVKLGGQMPLSNSVYLTGNIGWLQQQIDIDEHHSSVSDRTERRGIADVGIQYINANGFNVGVDVAYNDETSVNFVIGRYF